MSTNSSTCSSSQCISMTSSTDTTFASASALEEARTQLDLGNHREASRFYWEASTQAIKEASVRIGWRLERRLYADVMKMLAPWFPLKRTSKIYSSMLLLRTNALEDYGLGEVWMRELADDVHELFDMLQFAVSKHDD